MNKKTAWTIEDAMAFLNSIGLDIVEVSSFKPYYLKRTFAPGVNHWCVPCWEFRLMGTKKYLRMDQAELFEFRPDKLTPIRPLQGVRLYDSIRFKFLRLENGKYLWRDVDDPSLVGEALWEEIVAPVSRV